MADDRYTDHPALRPTVLASAVKTTQRQPQPSPRGDAVEEHGARLTPRAA